MKIIRSPLSYPGGKRWLFSEVYEYIPEGADVVSPFFGGGAIEINCALRGHRVYGYDLFEPLVNFWQHYLDDPKAVIDKAKGILLTNGREHFQYMQKEGFDKLKRDLDRAVYYYLLNKMVISFLSHLIRDDYLARLTPHIINCDSASKVKGISIENQSFDDTLKHHKSEFVYLDPPYFETFNFYGKSKSGDTFDHYKLYDFLKRRDNWVLSYNDDSVIRDLYSNFNMKNVYRDTNSQKNGRNRYELLIFSHDITPVSTPEQQLLFL